MATHIDGQQGTLTDLARVAEATDSPVLRLRALSELIDVAERDRRIAAAQARRGGATWAQVAEQLGTTRQAAQQRYGRKPETAGESLGSPAPSGKAAKPVPTVSGVGDWELTTRSGRVLLVLRRIRRRPRRRQ